METILEMRNITKKFGDVIANDNISLDVKKGEIHGLLGENGAGKTTLMNILIGLHQPDSGEIIFEGRPVKFKSPKDAIKAGIGMVHQHFTLVSKLKVLHNLILGFKTPKDPLICEEWIKNRVNELSSIYGIEVDVDELVMNLSVGEEQRVEITKSLFRNVKLLILDEPTAVLTPQETRKLFSALKEMTKKGLTIIFITHKLNEALDVTDRITVLKRGKKVGTLETNSVTKRELAKMMIGRELSSKLEKKNFPLERVVLKVRNVWIQDDRGVITVKGVTFSVNAGEIFGIAGVSGNGQRELEEAIAGLRDPIKGEITVNGKSVKQSRDEIAYIPEDRIGVGLALQLSVIENLMLKDFRKYKKGLSLDFKKMEEKALKLTNEFSIIYPSLHSPASTLSGGNIQRLILARELSRKPKLVVASQPTRGLDIAATEYVRNKLVSEAERGCAILLISEDLDEILELCDRIAVIFDGKIVGVLPRSEFDVERIGYMMGGSAG